MRSRPFLAALIALSAMVAPVSPVAAANLPSGHFTWTGSKAADFVLPTDLREVSSRHDAKFNLDYTRYQQYAAPLDTYVDGAQVGIVSRNGQQLIVGGAYYPGARAARSPALSLVQVLAIAADLRGGLSELPLVIRALATRRAHLRLDPESGRLFYRVATGAPGANRYQEIDAQTGDLLETWGGVDQVLSDGQGTGVKGDTKQLSNPKPFTDLVMLTSSGAPYKLHAPHDTFITYDAGGGGAVVGNPEMTDAGNGNGNDNIWNAATQAAAVDAQYYAALTVQFYLQEFGWDMIADCVIPSPYPPYENVWPRQVRSVVHYGFNYANAFWDAEEHYMVYGDGNSTWRAMSAGQDVVSHELTHGVTQCRADLNYKKESGALNESISDIMATAAEFALEEPLSSNCRLAPGQTGCADWLLGEDLAKTASGAVIRNLAKPAAEGQPSHYANRVYQGLCSPSGGNDYCGVHTNSGIPNHAFYLLATGGRNARCSGPTDPLADCDVVVPATGLDHAANIWFSGFGEFTSADATMCDARNSTIAAATILYPGSVTDIAATILAWQAVGLGDQCDASTDFTISLSDPTIELAPDALGQTQLSLVRGGLGGDNTEVSYAVDWVGPATVTPLPTSNIADNSDGTTITVDAQIDATDGTYPVLVTATGAGDTHFAALSFVIDGADPVASVTSARFVSMSTVSTGGTIPLSITWSASDGQSGIASAELDHWSDNDSEWIPIYGPGAPSSPTSYTTTAGPHQFQVVATDAVGNEATSSALVRTLTAFHETGSGIVYTGTWSTNTTAFQWGTTRYSKQRRATATLTFAGTDVVWVAQRGPTRGVAAVFIDGVKTLVDLYSITPSERRVVFIASNLTAGQHTIKIKVKATLGRPRVGIDGIFVLSQ